MLKDFEAPTSYVLCWRYQWNFIFHGFPPYSECSKLASHLTKSVFRSFHIMIVYSSVVKKSYITYQVKLKSFFCSVSSFFFLSSKCLQLHSLYQDVHNCYDFCVWFLLRSKRVRYRIQLSCVICNLVVCIPVCEL